MGNACGREGIVLKTLLVYYTRTGKTESAAKEVASRLGGDLVRISDGRDRNGVLGFILAGFDAVSERNTGLLPVELPAPLEEYDLVVVCSPVWAARLSPIIRTFLSTYGRNLPAAAWLLTRAGTNAYETLFDAMDILSGKRRIAAVSLQPGDHLYGGMLSAFVREISAASGPSDK